MPQRSCQPPASDAVVRAVGWVTSQKNGASDMNFKRVLGLKSYKLHKLRRAMVRPGRAPLSGRVEPDETYLGGPEEGIRGRQEETKALVAVAAEEDGSGIHRIRIRRTPDASADSLYRRAVTFLKGNSQTASELMLRVHHVVPLLNRGG